MGGDEKDIDLQTLDIDDVPSSPVQDGPSHPQQPQPPVISGLSTLFKGKQAEYNENPGSSPSSSSTAPSSSQSSRFSGSFAYDDATRMRHGKRKSDESYPASSSPAGVSSILMSRHGRSSSASSNNSDNGRDRAAYGYLSQEDRWAPASFSPSQRPTYMPGSSPKSSSPSFDSYLSRRRSIGHQPPPFAHSSAGTSPTHASFPAYQSRASPSFAGGQSPAFGASSPPVSLPLHAHLHQPHVASTEEVIAHLNHSPHAHADLTPCPPPDADEPWIDLPPSIDATVQSPLREHAFPPYEGSTSDVVIPADVNLDRRRSDPTGLSRSPASRPARKANSSPARAPLRLSMAHTGRPSSLFLDGSPRQSASPASMHQRGRSDTDASTLRSPRDRAARQEESPTGQLGRTPSMHENDLGYPLLRQRSHSPSRAGMPLSTSPVELPPRLARRLSHGSGSSSSHGFTFPRQISSATVPATTSPRVGPHLPEVNRQSPNETALRAGSQVEGSPVSPLKQEKPRDFFSPDAKLFPPAPNHDLSLPPRSGWDLSDDADVSPLEEKSLEDAQASFDIAHELSLEEHDQDSGELRPSLDMSPSSPTMGTIPLPGLESGDQDTSPEWGAPLDFNRGPAVELETLSPEEAPEADPEGNDGFQIDMDEEGLTPLERIFLFAKSEHADHRETVSRMLPVWLEEVEVCEAVDYILPLFQGLIQDEDYVKEAFASSLDRLMWYFFSHCPLVELSAQHEIIRMSIDAEHENRLDSQLRSAYKEGLAPNIAVSAEGLQLFKAPDDASTGASMASVRQAYEDAKPNGTGLTPVSGTTLVGTESDKMMHDDDHHENGLEVVDRPLLPLDAFHGIMAALLMNEASTVSAVAQEAIVRFIQLLEDRNIKPTETTENVEDSLDTPRASEEGKRTHIHQHYDLPERARLLIRDDLIDNIVLALFQLENKPAAFATLWKDESNQRPNLTLHDDPSSKFSHFFDDPLASTSPTSHEEPDSQQGVFVGMTLIAMLADTRCLPVDLLEQRLLPNVIKCARDPLIVLKKQAVEVLGSLCRSITENAVQYDIAPVILDLSEDPSPTIRRAVAALLPDVTRKLVEEEDRRRFAVTLSDAFASDPAALVRQAYLEISGPLIYIFKDNVPEELLEHFTGAIADSEDGSDGENEKARDTFAPLIPAFAVAQPETPSHQASKNGLGWDVQDDHGRAIITAYNLPGVVLSVGELGWPKLRRLHAALALDSTVSQPRYLIASSIHDVAKAIGPRLTAQDLLPTFRSLTTDEDIEVVMRAFERFPEFLAQLPVESTNAIVQILCDAWHDKAIEDWRLREVLAEGLVATADRLKNVQRLDSLLEVLKEALYDRFTAVRTWACKAVPLFVRDLPRSTFYHNSVLSILSALADDGHHKHRATYCLCVMEMVDIDVELRADDLQQVADLAIDRVVDVRLLAARCFARALQPGKTYLAQHPSIFAKAIRSLKSDQSASVRDELRSIDISPFSNGATDSEVDDLLNEETSDSSDDDASPRSDSRTSTAQSLFGSAERATSSISASHDQKASDKYANGVTSYRSNSLVNGGPRDTVIDEDDSDDDESVDLESSTIYELDLEDLASSSTYLPTLADSLQSPTRDTPPLRNRSSGSLASTRLSNTPPNRSCQSERAGNASPWHFSMRDDEQYVTIDVTGHA